MSRDTETKEVFLRDDLCFPSWQSHPSQKQADKYPLYSLSILNYHHPEFPCSSFFTIQSEPALINAYSSCFWKGGNPSQLIIGSDPKVSCWDDVGCSYFLVGLSSMRWKTLFCRIFSYSLKMSSFQILAMISLSASQRISSSLSISRLSTYRHTVSFYRIFSCRRSFSSCSLAFCSTSSWIISVYCASSFSRIATKGNTPRLLLEALTPNLPSELELFFNQRRDYDLEMILSSSSLTFDSRLANFSSSLLLAD